MLARKLSDVVAPGGNRGDDPHRQRAPCTATLISGVVKPKTFKATSTSKAPRPSPIPPHHGVDERLGARHLARRHRQIQHFDRGAID